MSVEAYIGDGMHINSDFINGMDKEDAIETMNKWLEEKGLGSAQVNYRLREWIFARQRYWGEPIPIIHLEDGNMISLSEAVASSLANSEDYSPNQVVQLQFDRAVDWVNVTVNGQKGKRETSTMPGSAGSSWYFLRYIDPHNEKEIADPILLQHWL